MTATPEATILLQWSSIKDQAIVGAIEIYGPAGAAESPDLAPTLVTDPAAAPVTAPVTEPVQAPEALTALVIPGAYAPVYAPVYGSTFLQVHSHLLSCFYF